MTRYRTESQMISELIRLQKSERLVIQPKFQRRAVWSPAAQSFLVDTIIRSIPMPKIYVREVRLGGRSTFEVVDGQQRLRAILGFVSDKFSIQGHHHARYGDKVFSQLPFGVQHRILEYGVTVEMMENATDDEVWKLFARLNRYTVAINRQETRHAQFGGRFKQAVYKLSDKHVDELMRMRVISNTQFNRMREAELISDILVAIVDGISDIQALDDKYAMYDESFAAEARATELFTTVFERLSTTFGHSIRRTRFRNLSWFYSLMVAMADLIGSIPEGNGKATLVDPTSVSRRMVSLDDALGAEELDPKLVQLRDALARATSHVRERQTRHDHFYDMLTV